MALTGNNNQIGGMGSAIACLDAGDPFTGTRFVDDQLLQFTLGPTEDEFDPGLFAQMTRIYTSLSLISWQSRRRREYSKHTLSARVIPEPASRNPLVRPPLNLSNR